MEALDTVNSMQRYADWSVLANRAQYGLDMFSRLHRVEDRGLEYLQDAKQLCELLQKGIEATQGPITTSQLGSVNAVQPLIRRAALNGITPAQLQAVDRLLERILGGMAADNAALPISIDDAIDVFAKIAASYRDTIQAQLDSLQTAESTESRK
jgi:hypothetical protein